MGPRPRQPRRGGNVHIVYYDYTNTRLKYATNAGGSFTAIHLDSTSDAIYYSTSIVVDHLGSIHISYYDNTNYDLKYITNTPGNWPDPAIVDSSGSVGTNSSIAIDSLNNACIAYSGNGLKYATNKGGSWACHRLSTETIGFLTSIKVDSTDAAHIACFLPVTSDLRYVKLSVE